MVRTLSTNEVLAIHEALVADFASGADPISPPGLRSLHLLESAVSRQHTGIGSRLKYDSPVSNAASLAYGICLNHPFHNGNKRTSLVALLCHLDANDLMFHEDVSQQTLYDLMLKIADHGFVDKMNPQRDTDLEVAQIAKWVRRHSRLVERRERIVTFRELIGILRGNGFEFEDHRNNTIDLVRYEDKLTWLGLRRKRERIRVMRMPYPGDGIVVGRGLIRTVRERCELDEKHGVDSAAFYSAARPPDYFIAKYRKTLMRLSRV